MLMAEQHTSAFAERMVDALPIPVVATDPSGRVVALSAAARKLLSIEQDAVECGVHYDDLPIPRWARRPEMADPALLLDQSAENVCPIRDGDGAVIGAMQVLERDGDFSGEKLCAAMAHEIRNPLTGIQGFADLLQRDLQENDGRREILARIISGVRVVNATVSSMLDFCRPRPLRLEPVNLPALADDALALAGCTAHLRVAVDVPPDAATIPADRLQLLQALVNLVRNAAHATPDGGSLTVSACRSGESIRISVADTGRGMDAQTRANLFRPFNPASRGGTGLGLAIVRRIVQQHNGETSVESEPGRGTTITIVMPADENGTRVRQVH
ncbi:MAG TPA: ATP-binding protein [Planctomycetota bacterium]|nr:ATP-binding protein [Planctomycetota bacterium]